MSRLLRTIGAAAVSLIALVALSGCLKLDMDLKINSDDTVSGSMIFAFSKAFIKETGSTEDEFVSQLMESDDATNGLPKGGKAERYTDDEYAGIKLTFDRVKLSEFSDKQTEGSDDLKITHTDGKYHVSGVMDLTSDSTDPNNPLGGIADAMLSSFKVRIAITFPGKVTSHTGKLSGRTVVWEPKVGEKTTIEATSEEESSMPVALIAGVGGGVVLLGVGALLFFLMRRKPTATVDPLAPAGAYYPPPAQPYTTDPPPHQ